MSISLTTRHEEVSAFGVLLMVFWPLADMALAMYRRRRRRVPVSHPDRLHFHQLVMRALEIEVFGRRHRKFSNPAATLLMLPLIAAPIGLGVAVYDQPGLSAIVMAVCAVVFFLTYAAGMRFATRRTRPGLPRESGLAAAG